MEKNRGVRGYTMGGEALLLISKPIYEGTRGECVQL